jgi:hypothetical protein
MYGRKTFLTKMGPVAGLCSIYGWMCLFPIMERQPAEYYGVLLFALHDVAWQSTDPSMSPQPNTVRPYVPS